MLSTILGVIVSVWALIWWGGLWVYFKHSRSPQQGTILMLLLVTLMGAALLAGAAWWTLLIGAVLFVLAFYAGVAPILSLPEGLGHAASYMHTFLAAAFYGWHLATVHNFPTSRMVAIALLLALTLIALLHVVAYASSKRYRSDVSPYTVYSWSAPYSLIAWVALVGLATCGWKGFLLGVAAGYAVCFLIGALGNLRQGGLVPRKVRTEAAKSFLYENRELVQKVYKGQADKQRTRELEQLIDSIFRTACARAPSWSPTQGLSLSEVHSVIGELKEAQRDEGMKAVLSLLAIHIERTIYSSGNSAESKVPGTGGQAF